MADFLYFDPIIGFRWKIFRLITMLCDKDAE